MEYTVRRLDASMLASVAELERECFAEPWSEGALELLTGERGLGVALFSGDRVVAYGGMMCVLDEGQITNIAVSAHCRRRGLGRAVMNALDDFARDRGIAFLSLEVRESNTAARALYLSRGWREEGIRKGFYRYPSENAVIMTKEL